MKLPWKKDGDKELDSDVRDAAGLLDLAKYDLDGLRSDITSIVSPVAALQAIAKWVLRLAPVLVIVIALVFRTRMSGIVFWLFVILASWLAVLACGAVGGFLVLRRRVGQTTVATSRVVGVVELMHRDYLDVRSGVASLSIREVGTEVAEQLVLPAVADYADQAVSVTGPLAALLRPVVNLPLKQVERGVLAAVGQLPNELLTGNKSSMQDAAPSTADMVPFLSTSYEDVQAKVERLVGIVGTSMQAPALLLVVAVMVPLIIVLGLGWIAT